MSIQVYTASAFTHNSTGGNKAGVVLPPYHLTKAEKTRIAAQLAYSETAFVSESGQADYKLEYFTQTGEVPLCGHATIGTFATLMHLGMLEKPNNTLETKAGILTIEITGDNLIFMEQNIPVFYEELNTTDILTCFHTKLPSVTENLPIQIVSTGLKDILLPITDTTALANMEPHFPAISKLSREKNSVGIHAFSLVEDRELTAVCRNFAPLYGINEESATGTSNCALACYLYRYGLKQTQYIFEQGRQLKSISRIYAKIQAENEKITGVYVGGQGALLGKLTI